MEENNQQKEEVPESELELARAKSHFLSHKDRMQTQMKSLLLSLDPKAL